MLKIFQWLFNNLKTTEKSYFHTFRRLTIHKFINNWNFHTNNDPAHKQIHKFFLNVDTKFKHFILSVFNQFFFLKCLCFTLDWIWRIQGFSQKAWGLLGLEWQWWERWWRWCCPGPPLPPSSGQRGQHQCFESNPHPEGVQISVYHSIIVIYCMGSFS